MELGLELLPGPLAQPIEELLVGWRRVGIGHREQRGQLLLVPMVVVRIHGAPCHDCFWNLRSFE